ncbi:hypothetical protein [Marinobacterium weihaiense]|uniref:Uncharacterized protein n=1 Tax=Marinobacterium weihaiense TaxID=2851016 RepID=A0ABS6MGJ1_9GAMM|nr:hypothetical protein [Marinobacterium weihaiense]MBV0934931.1 hypothetical protein [Marinobacterium weihaiense]
MEFTEYLIPTLTLISAGYAFIAFYFYKKTRLRAEEYSRSEEMNKFVRKSIVETNDKVTGISSHLDQKFTPAIKNIEHEIKKINCQFSAEMILEKLKSNGYEKASLINDKTIITGVIIEKEGEEENTDLKVGHVVSVEVENSAILIESFSLTLEASSKEIYEAILSENANMKVSDFGIQFINDKCFLMSQSYIIYPKDTFHITPLIEMLDHLENSQVSLELKLKSIGARFENITIKEYAEARIAEIESRDAKNG